MQSYELVTIADLLKVPPDKRERCLEELRFGLEVAEFTFGEAVGEHVKGFTWNDDDSRDVTVYHGDEELLRLSITETGKGGR